MTLNTPNPGKELPLRLLTTFYELDLSDSPDHIVQAPGRDLWIAAVVTDTTNFTFHAPDCDGKTTFNWRSATNKQTVLKRPLPKWARYPAGVVVALCADGLEVGGVEAVIAGHETLGPRYDYGMGLVVAALWHEILDRPYTVESLTPFVDRVRRDYITSS